MNTEIPRLVLLKKIKVYSLYLRITHALLGLSIIGLFTSAWLTEFYEPGASQDLLWHLHIYCGIVLTVTLLLRLLLGLFGGEYSRLNQLFHLKEWIFFLRHFKMESPPKPGHHPLGSLAYLALYISLLGLCISGWILASSEHSIGLADLGILDRPDLSEIFEEPHEFLGWLPLLFIPLHLLALIWHEKTEDRPLSGAMLSGYQYFPEQEKTLEKDNFYSHHSDLSDQAIHSDLSDNTIHSVLPVQANPSLQEDLPVNEKNLSRPTQSRVIFLFLILGASFLSVVRAGEISYDAGKALFEKVYTDQNGQKSACTSCHNKLPTLPGKTPQGKILEPLSPAITPHRLTQHAKIEKWFKRNCKEVMGRLCTETEKNHILTYLREYKP